MGILALIGVIAAGVAIGMLVYLAIKLTIKAIIGLVKKLRAKGAKKTLVAELDSVIDGCTNVKSLKELEALKDEGVTHITAGIDKDGNLVDDMQMIENTDTTTTSEVKDLLGEEHMLVVEG